MPRMKNKTKFFLWTAAIALVTFAVIQRVPQIRNFVYGVKSTKTPPQTTSA